MLVFNIYARLAYYTTLSFLVGFTIYLFLLPYLFDVDIENCHCFGEAIVLSRGESIVKNIFLLGCLVFVSPKFYNFKKWEIWVMVGLCVTLFAASMIIQTPNYLYTIVHKQKMEIDAPLYETALQNSGKHKDFTDGKQLICMYSVICKYCQKSAAKLHLIMKNNQLPEDKIKAVFWTGSPDSIIYNFFADQKIDLPEYTTFRVDTFLSITNGRMPLILFSDNGKIVHKANYITLNEKEILNFFKFETE
jgi:hypothetical protein